MQSSSSACGQFRLRPRRAQFATTIKALSSAQLRRGPVGGEAFTQRHGVGLAQKPRGFIDLVDKECGAADKESE